MIETHFDTRKFLYESMSSWCSTWRSQDNFSTLDKNELFLVSYLNFLTSRPLQLYLPWNNNIYQIYIQPRL